MGFFDIFRRSPPPERRRRGVQSREDLIRVMTQAVGDEAVARLVAEALDRVGRDGVIVVQPGGGGAPYTLEVQEFLTREDVPSEEARTRVRQLTEALDQAATASERAVLLAELGRLVGAIATIAVNVASPDEFAVIRRRITEAHQVARQALADDRDG